MEDDKKEADELEEQQEAHAKEEDVVDDMFDAQQAAQLRFKENRIMGSEIMDLGTELREARPVLVAEAAGVMRAMKDRSTTELETNPMFKTSFDYVNRIDKFKDTETTQIVFQKLSPHLDTLHEFELCQLANLLPENAEEAKSIIPSIRDKISDDVLENLLQELLNYARVWE